MTRPTVSRRQVLSSGLALAGLAGGVSITPWAAAAAEPVFRWRGSALRVPATVLIEGRDAERGAQLAPLWEAELARLDRIFSLYRTDSVLSSLNRHGGIDEPPPELVELLSICDSVHRVTDGVFDPTVQPVWELYARHFRHHPRDRVGPGPQARLQARGAVGFDRVRVGHDRIEFAGTGMALTLNGIAQGYLTDRIAALLARAGVRHALVDIGEVRAVSSRDNDTPWRIRVGPYGRTTSPKPAPSVIELAGGAVATSSPSGFNFAGHTRHHHLFDVRSGASAGAARSVSVKAATAALADGLSTAFAMMNPSKATAVANQLQGVSVPAVPTSRATLSGPYRPKA